MGGNTLVDQGQSLPGLPPGTYWVEATSTPGTQFNIGVFWVIAPAQADQVPIAPPPP